MTRKKTVSITVLFVVAIVIAVFSYNTVWLGDDINYAFDFRPEHNDEIVSSFSQIISSLNEHYQTVNGRYVPHILVQAFCGIWGHGLFALVNGLMYIVFMIALCRLCKVRLDNLKGVLSVAVFSLIVFQAKMVPSCQIGYIWTFSLVMIFLLGFFTERNIDKWWQILLLGLFSLIAGNGNESLNIGVSGALIIYWISNMRKMSTRQYIMMICFGLGTLAICLSPAAYARAASSANGGLVWLYKSVTCMFMTLKASFVMIAIILWKVFHEKKKFVTIYKLNSFYFNIWLIMILFNAIIGFQANRQVFGAELAAIIISVRLLKSHSFTDIWLCISTIVLIILYLAQSQLVFKVKACYDEIVGQYAASVDGKVYVDINQANHVPYSMEFSPILPLYGVADTDLYEHTRFEKWLGTKYPGKGDLRILPTLMRDYKDNCSAIYALEQPGLYLVVKSSNDDLKPYIERVIDKPFIHKEYPVLEVDMNDRALCFGQGWKARYVYLEDFTILGLTDNRLYLK